MLLVPISFFWWSCVLGQDSHGRRVREVSLTIWRWVGVGLVSFPGRRASTMWRDDAWTVVYAGVFLGTFVERSKTPVTMLRLRLESLFCTFLIIFVAFWRTFFFSSFSWWKDCRIYQFWIEVWVIVLTKQSRIWYMTADWIRNWLNEFTDTSYIYIPSYHHLFILASLISIKILVTSCNFAAKFWSSSAIRQFLRHGKSNLVLVINHDHIISFRRPFVSSQAGSRYYFSLSNRKYFHVFLLWFVRNRRGDDAAVNN